MSRTSQRLLRFERSCDHSNNFLLGNPHRAELGKLLHFNLYIDTSWKVEGRKRIDGLWIWIQDINDSLVDTHLKLLASVLVDESGTVDGPLLLFGRQRDRADHYPTTPFGRFDDHTGRLIDDLVIIRTDLNPHTMGASCFHDGGRLYLGIGHVQWRGGSPPRKRRGLLYVSRGGEPPRFSLFDDLSHDTSANRLPTLTDGETHFVLDGDWSNEFNNDLDGVTWLNHSDIGW